jgi:large subunit ribosomal protein L18
MAKIIQNRADRRKKRVRLNIVGKNEYPRISVFRSNKYIYAQLIDDVKQITIVSETDMKEKSTSKITKKESAKLVGEKLAKKILEAGIKKVIFDRGSYKYTGRVQAVADGVRAGGVEI